MKIAVLKILFNVLQAHCNGYEGKILNVKLVIKYCNKCSD